METQIVLAGFLSVQAALEAKSRSIHQILIHDKKKYDQHLIRLRQLAQSLNVSVDYISAAGMQSYVRDHRHGGVVALAGERRFCQPEALLPDETVPFVVMLDGVEDPYNLGYAIRSMYAAGVNGLVLRPRDWVAASTIITRASAGTFERLPIAVTEFLESTTDYFRSKGLRIVATTKDDQADSLYKTDFSYPLFLIIGGERRGISSSLRDHINLLVQIPYGREFPQSMGTVAATSAIVFEVMRQRMMSGQ